MKMRFMTAVWLSLVLLVTGLTAAWTDDPNASIVQGSATGTALPITGAVTSTVSGSVTANQGTAGISPWLVDVNNWLPYPWQMTFNGVAQPVTAAQSGSWTVGISGTPIILSSQSGAWMVGVNNFPSSFGVTQGTNPWTISGTVTTNQGTSPWLIGGTLTTNVGPPGANNLGTLSATANASAPTFTEGNQVALSTDLSGNLRVVTTGGNTVTQGTSPWIVGFNGVAQPVTVGNFPATQTVAGTVTSDQGVANAGGTSSWPVRMVGDRLVAIQSPFNLNVDRISQGGQNSAIGLYTISNIFGLNDAGNSDIPVNVVPFNSTPLATDNALATQSQIVAMRVATGTFTRIGSDTPSGAAGSAPTSMIGLYTNSVGMALDTNLGQLQSLTCRQLSQTPAATDECLATNAKLMALRGFTGTISPVQIDTIAQAETAGTTAMAGIYALAVPTAVGNSGTLSMLRTPQVFKVIATAASGNTAIWTPASGKKVRVMRWRYTVTGSATTAGGADITIKLFDGTSTVTGQQDTVTVPAAATTLQGQLAASPWIDLGNGYLSTTANNTININLSAALSAGTVTVEAVGTEE